jgi:hypothetical protein
MHLPGQKQRRTTDAATMQEKETLVRSPGQKMHSNSHTQKMIKLGQNRAKNQPQGRPVEVQKRALGGEASVNQPEKKKQRAYTSRSAQSGEELCYGSSK